VHLILLVFLYLIEFELANCITHTLSCHVDIQTQIKGAILYKYGLLGCSVIQYMQHDTERPIKITEKKSHGIIKTFYDCAVMTLNRLFNNDP
jgi:hypothetical protein